MTENKQRVNKKYLKELSRHDGDTNLGDLLSLNDISSDAINYYLAHTNSDYILEASEGRNTSEDEPLVSFLMTTWNRKDLLETTLESIFALAYSNFQFVIVDDHSTDGTDLYIQQLQNKYPDIDIIFIKTKGKQGPGLNKRLGFEEVTGDYVIFIDDDDFYIDKNWIGKALNIFKDNPTVGSVWFNSLQLYMNTEKLLFPKQSQMSLYGLVSTDIVLEGFQDQVKKPQSTFPVIFDTKKYRQAGAEEMKILNDTSIYLRGILAGDVYISDAVVGVYRIHDGSIGKNVSFDFIIDNVEEKKMIANRLPSNISKEHWFYKQSTLSWNYYFAKSRVVNWKGVTKWSRHLSTKYRLKFYLGIIKQRLGYYLQKIKH